MQASPELKGWLDSIERANLAPKTILEEVRSIIDWVEAIDPGSQVEWPAERTKLLAMADAVIQNWQGAQQRQIEAINRISDRWRETERERDKIREEVGTLQHALAVAVVDKGHAERELEAEKGRHHG